MTTIKQTVANRANAKASTGPRSPEGKRTSSANAIKHGLFGKNTPVREQERPLFLQFSDQISADLQPLGPTEEFYVDHLIDQCWRLRSCLKLETDLFEWYRTYKDARGSVGVAFAHDASQLNCFARLSRYVPLFEGRLAKDLAELRTLQARRCQSANRPQETIDQGPAGPGPKLSQEKTLNAHLTQGLSSVGQKIRQYGLKLLLKPTVQSADSELVNVRQAHDGAENTGESTSEPSAPAAVALAQEAASSGPSTSLSRNPPRPVSFGTFSAQLVLSDEDRGQFQAYCQSLLTEWQPAGATKTLFVELFAATSWRLARLSRVEAGLYEQYHLHAGIDGGMLTAFAQDASELDCFGKLAHYETQMRASLSRILKELLR
jgi:hypothetical protein